jgi:hypothetical protein
LQEEEEVVECRRRRGEEASEWIRGREENMRREIRWRRGAGGRRLRRRK